MIIVLKAGSTEADIATVEKKVVEAGLKVQKSLGSERIVLGVLGNERKLNKKQILAIDCVENIMPVLKPYKLVSREFKKEDTIIDVCGVKIGGKEIVVMAGPCAVENQKTQSEVAAIVKDAGAKIMRGGAFKPRTSPYDFQGMKEEGLKILKQAKEETGMPIITEVMDVANVELVAKYADILQIGARNMQNFDLLKAVGKQSKPVMLKRGMSATLKEFLMCAEYIMSEGNQNVILCERGIRTFCTYTRNTLDLNIIPMLKKETHLPVIVDPSHATGVRDLVTPLSLASIAAGADGLIIESHNCPECAMCDGAQSLLPDQFKDMMGKVKLVAEAVGRTL